MVTLSVVSQGESSVYSALVYSSGGPSTRLLYNVDVQVNILTVDFGLQSLHLILRLNSEMFLDEQGQIYCPEVLAQPRFHIPLIID